MKTCWHTLTCRYGEWEPQPRGICDTLQTSEPVCFLGSCANNKCLNCVINRICFYVWVEQPLQCLFDKMPLPAGENTTIILTDCVKQHILKCQMKTSCHCHESNPLRLVETWILFQKMMCHSHVWCCICNISQGYDIKLTLLLPWCQLTFLQFIKICRELDHFTG